MRDLDAYTGNFQTVAAFKLMWWTLCRPTEATGAEWAEFDLDAATWTIQADWIERQLAHIEQNAVRRTYNHADHFTDRAEMMRQWANWLDSLKTGTTVIPLRRGAAA